MEDYLKLYEKEVNEKILNYNKLILKYIKLLYLYSTNINSFYYHNLNFLKKVIIGFNYYQNQYIGQVVIPNDFSLKLINLWNNIINSDKDLTELETLMIISSNIVSYLHNNSNNKNICESLILNLMNVYSTLEENPKLIN